MKKVHRTLEDYQDLLYLPHHVSETRPQMPIYDRAAQFSPFAAVVGHEAAVKEAARYTDQRKELDEMEKAIIDEKLREIDGGLRGDREVRMDYFVQDPMKAGGQYISHVGKVKTIDTYMGEVVFTDETRIAIREIYRIYLD